MIEGLKNKTTQKQIAFTMAMLAIFAIGASIPIPFVDRTIIERLFTEDSTGLFELFNMFTGGSFQNFTIFALGVTPYITASIIIQLFTIASPYFENLAKEGEPGRKKMQSITRYLTIVLAFIQGAGIAYGLFRNAIQGNNALYIIAILMLLTAGTSFLMWLGEQINEYGIGNGMSLLIFAGIVIRLPATVMDLKLKYSEGSVSIVGIILVIIGAILLIASVIILNEGERRIPIQYAKRIVGRKTIGGQSTHIPMKINPAGVIPVIFSLSILQFPVTIAYFRPQSGFAQIITKYLSTTATPGVYIYLILNFILTVAFTFFYSRIVFKTDEIADNLASNGGSVPGIRPGNETKKYLQGIMTRLCWIGGIALAAICSVPTILSAFTPINLMFGGTSLIIIVGVALDTMKQVENRNTLNTYKGFLNRKGF